MILQSPVESLNKAPLLHQKALPLTHDFENSAETVLVQIMFEDSDSALMCVHLDMDNKFKYPQKQRNSVRGSNKKFRVHLEIGFNFMMSQQGCIKSQTVNDAENESTAESLHATQDLPVPG